jgi:L-ascorbate metabolism protein UlaG (beta-lactamase superfamily)
MFKLDQSPQNSQRNWLLKALTVVVVVLSFYGCNAIKSLGSNPSGEALQKIEALPNYKNGQFQNLDQSVQHTTATTSRTRSKETRWLRLLKFLAGQPKELLPSKPLIAIDTDLVNTTYDKPTVVWFGHSSFLLKAGAANILVDPSFSGFAGPFKGAIKAFAGSNVYDERDMPVLDALVISHDHYDHLDYLTVKRLRHKIKRVIVPIGVGSHFLRWGFPANIITELNWNDSLQLTNSITITATPAHHRSNRTLETRKTLWASYVIRADGYKIFYSGDTGYSNHFKLIGGQYGPFDLALMECGQYNVKWPFSHMFPHQTAQAAIDVGAAMTIPVHWGKYAESDHGWNESINLYKKAVDSLKVPVLVPFIGMPYTVGTTVEISDWWNYF